MKHINVGDLVKQYECHEGMDTDFNSLILDEDKLLDEMVRALIVFIQFFVTFAPYD